MSKNKKKNSEGSEEVENQVTVEVNSEKNKSLNEADSAGKPAVDSAAGDQQTGSESKKKFSKGALLIITVILLSLIWNLLADRYTPYTNQARVQGFVVGVAPKVSGIVTKVYAENDQRVVKGQPLFEIDRANYEIALAKAESDLQKAESQLGAGTAGVESATAHLRAAKANELKAEQDANRQERLYQQDSGSISVRRLEIARANLEYSRAMVTGAEAEVQRAIGQRGGDETDNSLVKAAVSALEKAQLDLENTVVRASSEGMITDLRTDVGQFAGAGSPVMTLIAIQDVWIIADFKENNLGHLAEGDPVEILLDALPGEIIPGKVHSIGLGVSATKPPPAGNLPTIQNNRDWLRQTQRFPVVIHFEANQIEKIYPSLRIGGQVDVIAFTDDHSILKLLGESYIRFMSWISYAY